MTVADKAAVIIAKVHSADTQCGSNESVISVYTRALSLCFNALQLQSAVAVVVVYTARVRT